jgi:hypothetical protein
MAHRLTTWEPPLPALAGDSGAMLGRLADHGETLWLVQAGGIVEEYRTREQAERRLSTLERGGLTLWQS